MNMSRTPQSCSYAPSDDSDDTDSDSSVWSSGSSTSSESEPSRKRCKTIPSKKSLLSAESNIYARNSDTSVWSSGSSTSSESEPSRKRRKTIPSKKSLLSAESNINESNSDTNSSSSRSQGNTFSVLLQVKKRTYRISVNATNVQTFVRKIEKKFHKKFPGKIIKHMLLETGKNKYCHLEKNKVSIQFIKSRKVIAIKIKYTNQKPVVMLEEQTPTAGRQSLCMKTCDHSLNIFYAGYQSLEELLRPLSGGQRNTVERYINRIGSHFQSLVNEVIYLHQNLPTIISRLKEIRDELDCWHRGTNCVIMSGSTASAISSALLLYSMLIAPVTAGTSLAAVAGTLSALGASTSIGGMVTDSVKQHYSCKNDNNIIQDIDTHRRNAETHYNEFRRLSEQLRAILQECHSSLSGLDEDVMFQFSLNLGAYSLSRSSPKSVNYLKNLVCGGLAAQHLHSCRGLTQASKHISSFHQVIQIAAVSTITDRAVRSVGMGAIRNVGGTSAVISKASKSIQAMVSAGSNVVTSTTTAFEQVGVTAINHGGKTLTKYEQLQAFITKNKICVPELSKLGIGLTAIGVVFDFYTASNAFKELTTDEKCNGSKQITHHIQLLEKLQEEMAQAFKSLAHHMFTFD